VLAPSAVVVGCAAAAWACVSGPAVNLSTANVKPGDQVTLTGTNFRQPDPVTVRWNALDGPILGTFDKPANGSISGAITVPADARAGNYVLIITQHKADGKLSQMPVRALLTVTPAGGAVPALGAAVASSTEARQPGLVVADNSVSGTTLALIAVGVAGVGMFIAGVAALFAGRYRREPKPVPVRT
jgi:hypothetical protein